MKSIFFSIITALFKTGVKWIGFVMLSMFYKTNSIVIASNIITFALNHSILTVQDGARDNLFCNVIKSTFKKMSHPQGHVCNERAILNELKIFKPTISLSEERRLDYSIHYQCTTLPFSSFSSNFCKLYSIVP